MNKYYKGKIVFKSDLTKKICDIAFLYNQVLNCSDKDFYDEFVLLNKKEQDVIINFFLENRNKSIIISNKMKSIFDKIFNKDKLSYYSNKENIIYELIIDDNNEYYAKEIITGNIFPIVKKGNINLSYEINKENEIEGFINIDNESDGLIGKISGEHLFISNDSIRYFFGKNPYNETYFHLEKMGTDHKKFDYSKMYSKKNINLFKLFVSSYLKFSNFDRCEVFIDHEMVANQREIDNYLEKYKNVFGNKRYRRDFINNLNLYASFNVLKEDIIPKKEDQKIKLDDVTKLMERIEFLLLKLRNYNEENYNKYKKKYDELIKQQNELLKIPITKSILESIEAGIILSLKFNKNTGNNLIEYLDNKRKEYYSCIVNHEKTNLKMLDVDKIMELFLKSKDEYDYVSRRKIVKDISFIYLLELYENKDNISDIELNSSYLKDNIMSIIMILYSLKELGLIESYHFIDINNHYNLEDIVDIIKGIKFRNIEKGDKKIYSL